MAKKTEVPLSGSQQEAPRMEVREYHWRDIRRRFGPYVRSYRGRLSGAMSLVALVGMAVAVMPLFPKYVIDVVIPQRMIVKAVAAGGCYILVMYVRMGLWFAAMRQVYFVQQSIIRDLRKISFQHLQHLSLNFHNQYPSGFLYERVFGNSINTLGGFLAAVFQQLATYAVGLLFSLGFCLYLSPPLTAVIVVGALGYVVAARRLSKTIYRKTRAANEAGMRVVGIIMDKLRGVKTVQASAMEAVIQREFESELWPTMRRWMDAMLAGMKLSFVTEGLSYLITSVVIVGGAALVIHGEGAVGIGTLVAFMGYQGTLIGMMQALTNMYGQFMSAKTAFDQLYTVLDTMPSVADASGAAMPREIRGDLAFEGVTFAYEPGKPVLRDVSLRVPYGQSVALVGRSGSGKTTLVNLLMRFHDPQAGRITLDGADIRGLPLRAYRMQYGVVLQDPYLFDTSIAANLRYAAPEATDAEIEAVLKRARAWEFASAFPAGIHHLVGEGGTQVSGGQRQRLAIARCMIMNRRFVLLDEATSALDVESESLVQESMGELFKGRTVFVIAHRLSTIRHVDRILVMDEGRVVEDGTFDALLAQQGLFHRLYTIATSHNLKRLDLDPLGI